MNASLGGCGLAETAIVCRIDAGWNAAEGADYYLVSVTRPDGSVVDLGESSGTSRSVYVPYVGPGTYTVEVAAWGTPPGEEEPEVIVREEATSTGAARPSGRARTESERATVPGEGRGSSGVADVIAVGDEPTAAPAPGGDGRPVCDEEPVDEEPAEGGEDPAAAAVEETAAPALDSGEESEQDPDEPVACP